MNCEASDIKAAGKPVPSRERVPDASRRLIVTESHIRERHKWHIRPVFSRRSCLLIARHHVAYSG